MNILTLNVVYVEKYEYSGFVNMKTCIFLYYLTYCPELKGLLVWGITSHSVGHADDDGGCDDDGDEKEEDDNSNNGSGGVDDDGNDDNDDADVAAAADSHNNNVCSATGCFVVRGM